MNDAAAAKHRSDNDRGATDQPAGKGTILAVDDSPDSLMLLTDILAGEGYDVRPADTGALALASVTTTKPDLILLDIRMPGMDGFEVCRRLKATAENRDIPVIFLSALTETRDRVEGLKLGAVDFVSKPFQREELLARIGTHLELSRLRRKLEEMVAERTAHLDAANDQLALELAERRRAERALGESEDRFRLMARTAPVGIWTSGPDTKVNFVNDYLLTLTGRQMEELTGDRWKEVVHPEDVEQRFPGYIPIIAAGREYHVEFRLRRSDGAYRWMLDTASPRFLPDGTFTGYIGVVLDITDWKQDQEHLLATQKLESMGVLVAGVAHNFNNLMGSIIAEADLALSELPASSPTRSNVERINATAIRAADIVYLLTAYASTGPVCQLEATSVSAVVEEILQLIRATVSKDIRFSVELSKKLPAVRADMAQLRQVVMNLLTNACESLPNQQGSVSVTTSAVHVGTDAIGGEGSNVSPGHYIQLRITDTGCGIPEDVRGRIFDPFYTTKFLGRGLGLAAVQGIVRSFGGIINVESTPGQGSSFELLLPAMHSDSRAS